MSSVEQEREKNRKILNDKTCAFEENHGSTAMFKVIISALNKLLVEKGIVSEREIINYFQREAEIQEKYYNDIKENETT